MASGDAVVRFVREMPPATTYATIDFRVGGSSPAEHVRVLDFDDTTTEYMDYLCYLENYGGGGLTFRILWTATSATSGDVHWQIAIRRVGNKVDDIDASHTYVYNAVIDDPATTNGQLEDSGLTFTDGSDMDSWADGELAIVRIRRNNDGSDTMSGDAELWGLVGLET